MKPLQSRHLGTSYSSPSCPQLPCRIFLNLFDSLKSSLSKVILALGKARSHRLPNLGCRGAKSPGWFDISPKNCMRCDAWAGVLLWWSCQSPVARGCSLLNHLSSFRRGMFKLNAKFVADSLLYLLSHFEYHGHSTVLLPPLTSTVKLSLFTYVHSSPLSLAFQVMSTLCKLFLLY